MCPTDRTSGLTQERLQALLHYEPATGAFTWRAWRPNGVKVGDEAGAINKFSGYRLIKLDGRGFHASRLAWLYMTGAWPVARIDHEDLNKANNAWANLRPATMAQNAHNRAVTKNNTSGFKGVSFCGARNSWQANIRVEGRLHHLGRFSTPERAHAAYADAAALHFGSYARVA